MKRRMRSSWFFIEEGVLGRRHPSCIERTRGGLRRFVTR